ncbi:MAG: DNA/RNA non-specific endonuclease [Bdellovibrionales bacterium]
MQADTLDSLYKLRPNTNCDIAIEYTFYEVCYSKEHLQAFWTMHKLTKKSIKGSQKRTNNFKQDDRFHPTIGSRDYRGSGYDRGHLVPAGDMKLNRTAMSETFFMTNMSPQRSGFNSGVWAALESGLRKEVLKRGDALVITAPILTPFTNYPRIRSGVSIPDEYYKIAYFPDEQVMLAFLIPNFSQKGKKYQTFQVTVDELEFLTGINFFEDLDDEIEEELESEFYKLSEL